METKSLWEKYVLFSKKQIRSPGANPCKPRLRAK